MSDTLTKEDFCARFKARMVAVAGDTFDDGKSIAEYADEIGPTYWAEQHQDGESPEDCADSDMSYWGEADE